MRTLLQTCARIARHLVSDQKGVAALEFALVVPFLLGALGISMNLAFQLHKRQQLDAAVLSAAEYLNDKAATGSMIGFTQQIDSETGEFSDGNFVATAKLIIQDSLGHQLSGDSLNIVVECGCPIDAGGSNTTVNGNGSFYQRSTAIASGGQICTATCPGGNQQRVLASISVNQSFTSLLGERQALSKNVVTRLR